MRHQGPDGLSVELICLDLTSGADGPTTSGTRPRNGWQLMVRGPRWYAYCNAKGAAALGVPEDLISAAVEELPA